jgi:hypothetical protein
VQIISLNPLATPSKLMWYRILNAGDNAISVERTSTQGAEVIGEVNPAQSLDFSVGQAGKDVFIHGLSSGAHLKGMYDFLGSSS